MKKRTDFIIGMLFFAATVIFIIVFLTNDAFFNWAFERHHNILSWYIRPLFIIPMVIFAFKKSYTGIFASIFALFTSMFWFSAPASSSHQVLEFLAFEMDYLKGAWTAPKNIDKPGSATVFLHASYRSMEKKLEMAFWCYHIFAPLLASFLYPLQVWTT